MNRDYSDIIHLPHHVSSKHPPMPRQNRAAQYAPFQALSGHGDNIRETARMTDARIEIAEDAGEDLDAKLRILRDIEGQAATFTFFEKDKKKAGGKYNVVTAAVKKIDMINRTITLTNGTEIPIDNILTVEGEMIDDLLGNR